MLLKKIIESESEYSVIFEDDVWFGPDLHEKILDIVDTNVDFDVIYLGNLLDNHMHHVYKNVYTIDQRRDCWGTHALLIKNPKKMYELNLVARHNIDTHYKMLVAENKLNAYVVYPSICSQAALVSHIDVGINGRPISELTIHERFEYYIGDTRGGLPPVDMKRGYDVPIRITMDSYRDYKNIHPGTSYPIDVIRYLKYSDKKELWIQCGDAPYTGSNYPVLVKTRDTMNSESKGIIAKLDSLRKHDITLEHLQVVEKEDYIGLVLASNSVPLMPKPRYHSWICEKFLVPGYHYVEVSSDFSDVSEKITWCKTHEEECKQIALQGQKFMMQFSNRHVEEQLEHAIVKYCDKHSSSAIALHNDLSL
jgi:GR25 family glycosyltransferase involved in LPS biosynthesis